MICFDCGQEVDEQIIEEHPDTELCWECLSASLESNAYRVKHKQTGEKREGMWDDLSNLEKRVWDIEPCIDKQSRPLCEQVIAKMYRPDEDLDGFYHYIKQIYSLHDLEGVYIG